MVTIDLDSFECSSKIDISEKEEREKVEAWVEYMSKNGE